MLSGITENDKNIGSNEYKEADFKVLKLINLNLLMHIERIIMEVHLKLGSLDIIAGKLRSTGFTVEVLHPSLIAKGVKFPIKIQNMIGLKIL